MELDDIKPKQEAPVDLFGNLRTDVLPKDKKDGVLAKRFVVPPFSVLDARGGRWQDRKREWIALGIKGEEGRVDIDGANNICSEKWGRGAESEFYANNDARCDGHGLSESQERLNAFKQRADAVPGGGGPNSARHLAAKDAGRCFGQDIMKGEHVMRDPDAPKQPGDVLGAKVTDRDYYRRKEGTRPALDTERESEEVNIAADKGYSYAAQENSTLDEKTQRALGVYAAPGGQVVMRGGSKKHGAPMEAGLAFGEVPSYDGGNRSVAGTSVFDPVLCECVYKWFAPKGGKILDPFAGESTKGIIASYLGYDYTGVELREAQVKANYRQAEAVAEKVRTITGEILPAPKWVLGDSSKLTDILDDQDPFSEYDFIWTSPPYYDLEIYSESEKDGSAFETYEKFMAWYKYIFAQAVAKLKPNRFAAVKVGEIRDDSPSGFYRNFEYDNIRVFEELGLRHYNRIVLVTAVGSLPVRVGSQFPKYRKVGNTHQMIYVFWKGPGSTKLIPQELGVLAQEEVAVDDNKQQ